MHGGQRNAVCPQPIRVDDDLILPLHTPNSRDLGDSLHSLQLEPEKPVLQTGQLRQVMLTGPIHQHVLVDPTNAGGVRSELGSSFLRQGWSHLRQRLQHARPRPVRIRFVVKDDVHIRITKERKASHRLGMRNRQHGGGQRVGDLLLNHGRRLPGKRRANNDLDIGQVRDRVHGRGTRSDRPRHHHRGCGQQHQRPIRNGPADQRPDHGAGSMAVMR